VSRSQYTQSVSTSAPTPTSRRRVRKVSRVLRDIDAWSVFKVGLVFHAALYLVLMITGILLWNVGSATGTINNLEQFMASFGWDSFAFKGWELFRGFAFFGLFGIVLATGIWVLGAVVFNLITELVGGIRVTVLEEEVVARTVEPDHTHG
jgi:hypothetical protein